MSEPLRKLIRDTLSYLKDPLLPKETLFASKEECALLRGKRAPPPASYKKEEAPKPSFTPRAAPIAKSPPPVTPPEPVKTSSRPVEIDRTEKPASSKVLPEPEGIQAMLKKIAPGITLANEVPDDAKARKIASGWKDKITDAQVVLLACENDGETLELLKNLAKAIDTHLAKAKIVPAESLEKEKRWDLFLQKNALKLIVASDGMKHLSELMQFYRGVLNKPEAFLDKIPLLVLAPAATYKSIEQKASLWKTLSQMLKP